MDKTSPAQVRQIHTQVAQTHYLTLDTVSPVLKLPKEQILELEDTYRFFASQHHPTAERFYTTSDIKRLTILRYLIRDQGISPEHIFYAWKAKEYEEATLREEPINYHTTAPQHANVDYQLLVTVTSAISAATQYAYQNPLLARQQIVAILHMVEQALLCETVECVITLPDHPEDTLLPHLFAGSPARKPLSKRVATTLRKIASTAVAKRQPILNPANPNRSICAFPLLVGTALYGTITWARLLPNRFTDSEIQLLMIVATQLSPLLHSIAITSTMQTAMQQLEDILSALPEGIIIRNSRHEITQWNEAALDMAANRSQVILARKNGQQLIPEWHTQLPSGQALPYSEVPSIKALLSGKPVLTKHLLMKREGEQNTISILATAVPVKDVGHVIQGSIVIFQDMSHVSQFSPDFKVTIKGKAHELNNKLFAASIGAETIQRSIQRYETNTTLNNAEKYQRLTATTKDIIAYIKSSQTISEQLRQVVESGLEDTNEVSFVQCLIEQVESFRVPEGTQRVSLPHTNVRDAQLIGLWRKMDIESIINNLIGNALKYSAKSTSVELSLTLDQIEGNPAEPPVPVAHLIVKDYGRGIAASDLVKIFEEGERGDTFHQKNQNIYGNGQGLALVKNLVTKYNGVIYVESELGKGSSFHVLLPIISPNNEGL